MAKGRWIGIDEYYNQIGVELFPNEWDRENIKLLIPNAIKNKKNPNLKIAKAVRAVFYERIGNKKKNIQVMYGDGQGYAPATFEIKGWYIPDSICYDYQAYPRKCKIFESFPEARGRPALNELTLNFIFQAVDEIYISKEKSTSSLNIAAIHAKLNEVIEAYNQENKTNLTVPASSTVSAYVRKKYPESKKKTRNSK